MTRSDLPEDVLVFDPEDLDVALIGITMPCPGREVCAVYAYEKLVEAHVAMGMSVEDAEEWIIFNTIGAWAGEGTPVVVNGWQ